MFRDGCCFLAVHATHAVRLLMLPGRPRHTFHIVFSNVARSCCDMDVVGCAALCRWGATLVVYKPERLTARGGRPVVDWADLLQPQLEGEGGNVRAMVM